MKLYLDGNLAGTNAFSGKVSTFASGWANLLGACTFRPNGGADFHGQMDEVRLWKTARTQATDP
jgi:hypothetical protein